MTTRRTEITRMAVRGRPKWATRQWLVSEGGCAIGILTEPHKPGSKSQWGPMGFAEDAGCTWTVIAAGPQDWPSIRERIRSTMADFWSRRRVAA